MVTHSSTDNVALSLIKSAYYSEPTGTAENSWNAALEHIEEGLRASLTTASGEAARALILPERITPEIACILEDCSGPEHQSEISLAALMEGYEPTWEQLREHLLRSARASR